VYVVVEVERREDHDASGSQRLSSRSDDQLAMSAARSRRRCLSETRCGVAEPTVVLGDGGVIVQLAGRLPDFLLGSGQCG